MFGILKYFLWEGAVGWLSSLVMHRKHYIFLSPSILVKQICDNTYKTWGTPEAMHLVWKTIQCQSRLYQQALAKA